MTPFTLLDALVLPLDRPDVDTDAILPKQFMASISRGGFGAYLFDAWRYLDAGYPGKPLRTPNPDFVLNQPRYQGAQILLARDNFGCGSSREHALWALTGYGFRAVIAPSFADIFRANCYQNGVLPVTLAHDEIDALFAAALAAPGLTLQIDLAAQQVRTPAGRTLHFAIDAVRKQCLLEGLDEIAVTLGGRRQIQDYETQRRQLEPWLF